MKDLSQVKYKPAGSISSKTFLLSRIQTRTQKTWVYQDRMSDAGRSDQSSIQSLVRVVIHVYASFLSTPTTAYEPASSRGSKFSIGYRSTQI